jgi:hypothetical protein
MAKKKNQEPVNKLDPKYPLGWVEVNIEDLVPCDWNYKTNDTEKAEKLKKNIKLNGLIENIIIYLLPTGFYSICNGNHRYSVLKELGIKKIMTFNLGSITESKAKRIAVETNETRFSSDNIKLAELIKEISSDFSLEELAVTMPFDVNELENFQKMLDFDWEQFEKPTESEENIENISGDDVELVDFNIKITKETLKLWEQYSNSLKSNLNDLKLTNNKILEYALAEGISSLGSEE